MQGNAKAKVFMIVEMRFLIDVDRPRRNCWKEHRVVKEGRSNADGPPYWALWLLCVTDHESKIGTSLLAFADEGIIVPNTFS
jgi:hypothetical protein